MNQIIPVSEAELIEFAKTVRIVATRVLEGLHPSARGGEGVEFHSNLPYSEGEDIKHLDWKRYAATDKFFVSRFAREEKAGWQIYLDRSSSMAYREKSNWAKLWAACISFLAKTWGDKWEIFPETSTSLDENFELLLKNQIGFTEPTETLTDLKPTRDRLLVLSDFFWETEVLDRVAKAWTENFSQVCFIQILDPHEASFDFAGVVEFRDLESPHRLILDSGRIRKRYFRALQNLQEHLSDLLPPPNFSIALTAGKDKIETQLLEFFERLLEK